MKISMNGEDFLNLTDSQMKVLQYYLPAEQFDSEIKRRIEWVIMHLHDESKKKLIEDWKVKFVEYGANMLPTNEGQLLAMIFAHPKYKDRSERDRDAAKASQALE